MIWWPFNDFFVRFSIPIIVVTHQWSGDLSILTKLMLQKIPGVVTHQWSGDLSISLPMQLHNHAVVTHQWSGDLSISVGIFDR